MNLILFDDAVLRKQLLPLSFTRPLAAMRVGILQLSEKWQHHLPDAHISYLTESYLRPKYGLQQAEDNLLLNGALCPSEALLARLKELQAGEALYQGEQLLAARLNKQQLAAFDEGSWQAEKKTAFAEEIRLIANPWEIFSHNGAQIRADFELLTKGRTSAGVNDKHTIVYAEENIFIEEGAKIRAAVLNAENGPIYIGKNAQIQEGSVIHGPFALCESAVVNMGGKMRSDSTIGPFSKVGGEINNAVIFGYSNKGHEGFLGNSVLGEWCNLGADTNNSNLKNNYAQVKLWSYKKGGFVNTGLQFCGLVMGDHSKCGINTMFNTGTVVGVSANIFGSGFPRNFVPSFSWGGANGFTTFQKRQAFEVAERVMARRNKPFDETEQAILEHIFEATADYRQWEKAN